MVCGHVPMIDRKRVYRVLFRGAQARYAVRSHIPSMSMTATRSEARCRACSVAVHKSDQSTPTQSSQPCFKTRGTYFCGQLYPPWTVAFPTNDSFVCLPRFRRLEKLRRLCSTYVRSWRCRESATDISWYHVTAAIWLALSTFQQSSRKPGVLAQTYFFHLAPQKKIRLARETRTNA